MPRTPRQLRRLLSEVMVSPRRSPRGAWSADQLDSVGSAAEAQVSELVLEYARFLGMDVVEDKQLLWIAEVGLREQEPEGWTNVTDPFGNSYFFNATTDESLPVHPLDHKHRTMYTEHKAAMLSVTERDGDARNSSNPKRSKNASPRQPEPVRPEPEAIPPLDIPIQGAHGHAAEQTYC